MNNIIEVYFALSGGLDFNPNEANRILDIECSSSFRMGERSEHPMLPRHSSWKLSSGRIDGENISVYDHSEALINKLTPKELELMELIKNRSLTCKLQVVLYISVDENVCTPAIGFDSEVIAFLGRIGAIIDIDSYRNWDDK
jgi:hypothetical protein